MGYVQHYAIVVTTQTDLMKTYKIPEKARDLFGGWCVSPVIATEVNAYSTLFIGPSGSKAGWHEAEKHRAAREQFKIFVESFRYGDGSSSISWAEIIYKDDYEEGNSTKILDCSDCRHLQGDEK